MNGDVINAVTLAVPRVTSRHVTPSRLDLIKIQENIFTLKSQGLDCQRPRLISSRSWHPRLVMTIEMFGNLILQSFGWTLLGCWAELMPVLFIYQITIITPVKHLHRNGEDGQNTRARKLNLAGKKNSQASWWANSQWIQIKTKTKYHYIKCHVITT